MNFASASPSKQVLRGLSLNREPGWNFPGNFLELSFDTLEQGAASLSLQSGPHCDSSEGGIALGALCVLADIALAASLRRRVGFAQRMATVQMSLSFTRARLNGLVHASSRAEGQAGAATTPQFFTRVEIRSGGAIGCTGSATFIALGNNEGLSPMPMRKREDGYTTPTMLTSDDLDDDERAVWSHSQAADNGAPGFLNRFWGLLPVNTADGAECRMSNGLHVGNRVGHTQGGISLALAAETASCAVGEDWALTNVTGWYIAPGRGASLNAIARKLHRGSRTATMECEIRSEDGRLVLRAVTTHAKLAP